MRTLPVITMLLNNANTLIDTSLVTKLRGECQVCPWCQIAIEGPLGAGYCEAREIVRLLKFDFWTSKEYG
jgi:hypothetical protein